MLVSSFLCLAALHASQQAPLDLDHLPVIERPVSATPDTDWLIDSTPFRARVGRSADGREIRIDNGLVRRSFRVEPDGACVGFDNLMTGNALLRAVSPEAVVVVDGVEHRVGGLRGQNDHAYLAPAALDAMTVDLQAMRLVGYAIGTPAERLTWKRARHHAPDALWPPAGIALRLDFAPRRDAHRGKLRVSVHYELYDGVPLVSKWLTVHNDGASAVRIDRFRSETLAVVEPASWVETRDGVDLPRPTQLHVETDFSFGGFVAENANRHVVHWRTDPDYATQVNYLRRQPCRLVVEPTYGPAQDVAPGAAFVTCRAFELVYDSTDRERRGLALRRAYRRIAPWVTENPLMMHMRSADPARVREAIAQCAAVGFEMLILSFGSGFDIETDDPATIEQWRTIAAEARAAGVEIGGYSLLSSRRIGGGNDIVPPEGEKATHGSCPALTSPWGQTYFAKLRAFFDATGFTLLEHDGPYPGDVDTTPRPPLQKGLQDSRWAQWQITANFYTWCRARGIYVNAPDRYFLNGTNKCGMGYRETNWSLPRAQQVIHTRQNIYDGTWTKTPSMGWMFVPLTEYHGGGAAATIEPLDEHLDHYDRMLCANLALGVQACYRGPRLYDTDRTRALVAKRVAWFKQHRAILESDVVHGRRADGRDVDWMLHVGPGLDECGMLVAFNPLPEAITRTLRVDLRYTGLRGAAQATIEASAPRIMDLTRGTEVDLTLDIPAQGFTWVVFRQP